MQFYVFGFEEAEMNSSQSENKKVFCCGSRKAVNDSIAWGKVSNAIEISLQMQCWRVIG
jgi:hypothetical protein